MKLRFWCNTHGYVNCGFGEPIESINFNQRGEIGLWCPFCHKARPMKIERYTGMNDKKGIEIYESDIVEFKFGNEKCYGVVKYDESIARYVKEFTDSYGKQSKDLSSYASSHIVVGNINMNPEFL